MRDELLDVGALQVERERGSREGAEQCECAGMSGDGADFHDADFQEPISFRGECSDINMPKPANRVTMEVPP